MPDISISNLWKAQFMKKYFSEVLKKKFILQIHRISSGKTSFCDFPVFEKFWKYIWKVVLELKVVEFLSQHFQYM